MGKGWWKHHLFFVLMKQTLIHEKYRYLAAAAIEQGINDFLSGRDDEEKFDRWTSQSVIFDYLGLDRVWIVSKVKDLKRCGVKHIEGVREYGKRF